MLKLTNISKYYHSNDVVALGLRKVNLEFKLGEFVAVTGESGSGKSTLLNVISGLDTYEDGEMYVNGEETSYFSIEEWESYRRQYIGFVFQNYNIIDSYSVLENVMVALQIQGYDPANRRKRALELIEKVGLSSHTHHKASKLSGGQKQRAVIARALAKDCPIIVCDEPTGNLDSESSKIIMSLLEEISKDKLVIVVTHNYDEVEEYATRKIRLFDGEVVEDKKIKSRRDVEESVHVASYRMDLLGLSAIALRNLFRTPKRTIFTMIVAMFIAIIFTFSYGSYISETNTGISWDGGSFFQNVTPSRVIVTKFDETAFTDAELSVLSGINRVNYLVKHDVVLDSYIYHYIEEYDWINTNQILINPASQLSTGDLTKGRLPANRLEVVVEDTSDLSVGDILEMGFDETQWKNETVSIPDSAEEYLVVGITKNIAPNSWRNRFYFSDDFIESHTLSTHAYIKGGGWEGGILKYKLEVEDAEENLRSLEIWYNNFIIDNTLGDNEAYLSNDFLDQLSYLLDDLSYEENAGFYNGIEFDFVGTSNFYTKTISLEVIDEYKIDNEKTWGVIVMNQNTYDSLVVDETYQVSLMVKDTYAANIVLAELEALEYNAIYPSNIGNQFEEVLQLINNIWFGVLMSLVMGVIYIISYNVLKLVQNSKKKDYLIFRSIGASKKDLNKVTILELFYTVALGYIVTMILLFVNEQFDTFLPQYLRFFTVWSYLLIFIVLSILSLLLGRSFNKRIFSKSVITSLKQEV